MISNEVLECNGFQSDGTWIKKVNGGTIILIPNGEGVIPYIIPDEWNMEKIINTRRLFGISYKQIVDPEELDIFLQKVMNCLSKTPISTDSLYSI